MCSHESFIIVFEYEIDMMRMMKMMMMMMPMKNIIYSLKVLMKIPFFSV